MRWQGAAAAAICLGFLGAPAPAQDAGRTAGRVRHWSTAWTGSVQGPYPIGNPSAQPDQSFAFPDPAAGSRDQTLRLVLRPDVWGREARLRISNAFGTRVLTLDGVHAGLQLGGAALVPGTNRPVLFGGRDRVTVPPGGEVWSDPVALPFAADPDAPLLAGRKLAVSLHVVGSSGPMTWHAKALQTSYVTAPDAGAHGADEGEAAFPFSTASWFFVDAVDMAMNDPAVSAPTPVVVAFGDSITDGTASTMNGDDRWPDVLSRRLHAQFGNRVAVVNAGIGGNQVVGPASYGPQAPFPGGPSALSRLDRDVIGLSGVASVIWLEGINDFSRNGEATLQAVQAGMREGVARLRAGIPGVRVIGATLPSAKGSSSPAHGHPEQDEKRRGLNAFIRDSGVFDGVVDFDAATLDPATGGLRPEMVPESTTGGKGDRLHPNRAGYLAMGSGIDLGVVLTRR
ncbi:lysophospholipase [Methylobacterium terricola]|uniref:Lysophospholipase n=1 Tax=Methylobacterium terricola TaxID=2583531 RepID=A0A5C4LFE4_9HYPH|nr:GDSL-type esterase/lipase family protein [Methylobacterium terricola]TNC12286.1 lysophospholipase [Methylobacterium terricola]